MIHFPFPGEASVPLFLAVQHFSLHGTHWPTAGRHPSSGGSTLCAGCTGPAGAKKVQDPRGIFLLHAYSGPWGPILVTFAECPLSREDLYSFDIEELNKGKKDFYAALEKSCLAGKQQQTC